MRINEVDFGAARVVDGYGPGFFRISGEVIEGPLLLRPQSVTAWGGLGDTAPLFALEGEVDVLFIGMGGEIAPLPAPLRSALEEVGIGLEIMASPPACRGYNVLLAEGRRIAAALLPVG